MKKTSIVCLLIPCFFHAYSQIDSLNSPAVWLRADKSELNATTWKDFSFFHHHAEAPSPLETPSLTGSINFNQALVFDGIDDYLRIPYGLDGLANLSVLAVFQSADTTERGIWGTEAGSLRNILLTTRKAIGPDTIADAYGNSEKTIVLNSVFQNWENASATTESGFMALGSAGASKGYKPFRGSLAELLVFSHSLTFLERLKYETYLAIKYGTGLHEANFISSGDKVLWHSVRNKAYGNNIAGIGRDDLFQLYQKQSGSAYDSSLLIMSAGTLGNSNLGNTSTFRDQDFLLWGDNGLALTAKRGEGMDSALSILQRKWLVTATGNTARSIPTDIHIDAAKLPLDAEGYWLVIDRSGKGDFSVDNLEYILPESVSNGKIIYKNVQWDTDGSGKDNFGFAQANELFAVVRNLADPSCTNETAGKVRIEIIAGEPPFHYSLTNADAGISRNWKQSQLSADLTELVAGMYSLSVRDDDAEVITRNFNLTMPDALHIDLGPDQIMTPDADITLEVSGQIPDSIPVSFRWENNFGFSGTDKRIQISETGIYRVFVTKQSDGCVFSDEVTISGSESQRIAVYPNVVHTSDTYNVSISLEEAGSVSVKVINSLGVVVQGIDGTNRSEYQFTASIKDAGMYLILVRTAKGIETRKIVVQ